MGREWNDCREIAKNFAILWNSERTNAGRKQERWNPENGFSYLRDFPHLKPKLWLSRQFLSGNAS
jgi:hypothetical protein